MQEIQQSTNRLRAMTGGSAKSTEAERGKSRLVNKRPNSYPLEQSRGTIKKGRIQMSRSIEEMFPIQNNQKGQNLQYLCNQNQIQTNFAIHSQSNRKVSYGHYAQSTDREIVSQQDDELVSGRMRRKRRYNNFTPSLDVQEPVLLSVNSMENKSEGNIQDKLILQRSKFDDQEQLDSSSHLEKLSSNSGSQELYFQSCKYSDQASDQDQQINPCNSENESYDIKRIPNKDHKDTISKTIFDKIVEKKRMMKKQIHAIQNKISQKKLRNEEVNAYFHEKRPNQLLIGHAFNRIRDFALCLKVNTESHIPYYYENDVEKYRDWNDEAEQYNERMYKYKLFNWKQHSNLEDLTKEVARNIAHMQKKLELQPKNESQSGTNLNQICSYQPCPKPIQKKQIYECETDSDKSLQYPQVNCHSKLESSKKENRMPASQFKYLQRLDTIVKSSYKNLSISKDVSIRFLELVKFLNQALNKNDYFNKIDKQLGRFKIVFYGPTICGLTISNSIQFSIDIIPDPAKYMSEDKKCKIDQHKIMNLIYEKFIQQGFQNKLKELFQLKIEKCSNKKNKPLQMNQVLNMMPTPPNKYDDKIFWNPNTRIHITSGNKDKILESILIQILCTISPQFNTVAVILKKWIADINCNNNTQSKYIKMWNVHKNTTIYYRWNVVIYIFIHYMQDKGLLPFIDLVELKKVQNILLNRIDFTSIPENVCSEHLLRIQKYSNNPFSKAKRTFGTCFQKINFPKDILYMIQPIRHFYSGINKNKVNGDQRPGILLKGFLEYMIDEFSVMLNPKVQKPISILKKKQGNILNLIKNNNNSDFIFLVQNPFQDNDILSLISMNIIPNNANPCSRSGKLLQSMEQMLIQEIKDFHESLFKNKLNHPYSVLSQSNSHAFHDQNSYCRMSQDFDVHSDDEMSREEPLSSNYSAESQKENAHFDKENYFQEARYSNKKTDAPIKANNDFLKYLNNGQFDEVSNKFNNLNNIQNSSIVPKKMSGIFNEWSDSMIDQKPQTSAGIRHQQVQANTVDGWVSKNAASSTNQNFDCYEANIYQMNDFENKDQIDKNKQLNQNQQNIREIMDIYHELEDFDRNHTSLSIGERTMQAKSICSKFIKVLHTKLQQLSREQIDQEQMIEFEDKDIWNQYNYTFDEFMKLQEKYQVFRQDQIKTIRECFGELNSVKQSQQHHQLNPESSNSNQDKSLVDSQDIINSSSQCLNDSSTRSYVNPKIFKKATEDLDKYVQKNSALMHQIYQKTNSNIEQIAQKFMPDEQFNEEIESCFKDVLLCLKNNYEFDRRYSQKPIQNNRYGYRMMKFGSIVNGLSNKFSSDLDLTFIIDDFNLNHQQVLSDIKRVLQRQSGSRYSFSSETDMPRQDQSGWILQFEDTKYKMDIDIMINKTSEVLNSMLILQYATIDKRFHQLALVIKEWNKQQFIKQKRFNSFSITLMLIAFMQKLKLVPNLQALAQTGPRFTIMEQQIQRTQDRKFQTDFRLIDAQNTHFLSASMFKAEFNCQSISKDDNEYPFDYKNMQKLDNDNEGERTTSPMTAGEILIKFLRFYGFIYDTQSNAIDISQVMSQEDYAEEEPQIEPFYKGKSIVDRDQIIMHIWQKYRDQTLLQYILKGQEKQQEKNAKQMLEFVKSKFLKEAQIKEKHFDQNYQQYLIVDPFNHTYNPAKNIKSQNDNGCYQQKFQEALRSLLINGLDNETSEVLPDPMSMFQQAKE